MCGIIFTIIFRTLNLYDLGRDRIRVHRPQPRTGRCFSLRFNKFVLIVSLFILTLTSTLLLSGTEVGARPQVAVVLGGGAARGFSHIGLLRALEEHGIPVDILVGTSMGSIVAGLYATGLSTDNLAYLVTHVDMSGFFTPVIPPKGGFVQADDFERFLNVLTEDVRFEQLPRPFYSVVTNVVTGEEVALHEGSLARGIVASMSIPGMFPPVKIGDDYYVDGGMLSPVPVHAARAHGADFVIAVDVRRAVTDVDHDNVLTNVQLTLFFLLDDNTDAQMDDADVAISPRVEENSYMEYDRAAEFIEEGYRVTGEAIETIRRALLEIDPQFPFGVRPPQAGLSPEEFSRRIAVAADGARETPRIGPTVRPGLQLRTGEPASTQLDVSVPVGHLTARIPIAARYSLVTGARSSHALGAEAGNCQTNCLTMFGRRANSDDTWQPGLAFTGAAGRRLRYTLAWESPGVRAPQWHVELSTPVPASITAKGYEVVLHARRDPRGLYGPAANHVRADGMYRHYFLGSQKNHWELLRGSTNWYVGAGVTAAFQDVTATAPLGEIGLLLEGRLFGLYPLRSRISATYDGGDESWTVRWVFGD